MVNPMLNSTSSNGLFGDSRFEELLLGCSTLSVFEGGKGPGFASGADESVGDCFDSPAGVAPLKEEELSLAGLAGTLGFSGFSCLPAGVSGVVAFPDVSGFSGVTGLADTTGLVKETRTVLSWTFSVTLLLGLSDLSDELSDLEGDKSDFSGSVNVTVLGASGVRLPLRLLLLLRLPPSASETEVGSGGNVWDLGTSSKSDRLASGRVWDFGPSLPSGSLASGSVWNLEPFAG